MKRTLCAIGTVLALQFVYDAAANEKSFDVQAERLKLMTAVNTLNPSYLKNISWEDFNRINMDQKATFIMMNYHGNYKAIHGLAGGLMNRDERVRDAIRGELANLGFTVFDAITKPEKPGTSMLVLATMNPGIFKKTNTGAKMTVLGELLMSGGERTIMLFKVCLEASAWKYGNTETQALILGELQSHAYYFKGKGGLAEEAEKWSRTKGLNPNIRKMLQNLSASLK